MVSDPLNVPVHCQCGWIGWRRPTKVKSRPCPNCDGEVRRWRALEHQETVRLTILGRIIEDTPLESAIAATFAPVPRLPNPYYLRTVTGEVQIFRIPAHIARRGSSRRRRGARR